MSHFMVFLKKELIEYLRTYKFLIVFLVFVSFGLANPLIAKLTPDLLAALMPEGVALTLPEATSLDAWAQFFKNTQQMGLIVLLLVFSGILERELSTGSLLSLLTRGLSRRVVILAKYTAMNLVWGLSLVSSFLLTLVYTHYLFPDGRSTNLPFALFFLWSFGSFLLAVLIGGASLIRNNYAGLLITGGAVLALMAANLVPGARTFNPLFLASGGMDLLGGSLRPIDLLPAFGVCLAGSFLLVSLAVLVFRRRQL